MMAAILAVKMDELYEEYYTGFMAGMIYTLLGMPRNRCYWVDDGIEDCYLFECTDEQFKTIEAALKRHCNNVHYELRRGNMEGTRL